MSGRRAVFRRVRKLYTVYAGKDSFMENEYMIAFVATFVFFAMTNLYISKKAYAKHGPFARRLGRAALLAMLINISYVASILAGTYRRASVFSSIYFYQHRLAADRAGALCHALYRDG